MDQAHLLMALLESAGEYRVTHAQDGDHGIRLVDDGDFDLVISDLNLPGTDGFDVIRHVKRNHPGIPVIATTGYTTPGYADEAFRAGADDLLLKPLDRDEVVQKLEKVLEGAGPGRRPAILALGAYPGDVELGCGGLVVGHRADGEEVLIVTFEQGPEGSMDGARIAAEQLGARVISARAAVGDGSVEDLLQRIVSELKPYRAYIPPHADDDRSRREAHRIGRSALDGVPEVLAYFTSSSGLDYRPDRFEDVSDHMLEKAETLAAYRATGRRELTSRFAQAAARYWGRFADFTEVEPFEVIRDESGS